MNEEEALSLIVQKRERMEELQKRSFNAKKKQINDVICTVKDICDKHFSDCIECPLYKHICNGLGGWQRQPYLWQTLD